MNHAGIVDLLRKCPHYRLFGEWLVKHSIPYPQECYQKFYMYDILDESTGEWVPPMDVISVAKLHNIPFPEILLM